MKQHQVLMILTSHDRLGDTGKPTGFWAEEVAVPYFTLVDAGVMVDLASPLGGRAPVDPGSLKPVGQNAEVVERFLADAGLQSALAQTRRAHHVDAARYDAIFFPGGHGTMWDLPVDAGVTRAVESAFATGRLIASVCHGAAALVTARRPDGKPIVEGMRVNAFTDAEETAVGLNGIVPFALESRLRELGAHFVAGEMWQPFVVSDGLLLTGQNPQSSALVAQRLLEALNRLPL